MSFMNGNVLLDSNVLVYSYDRSDLAKQRQAEETLHVLASAGRGAVSTQILGEFFTTVTRKLAQTLSLEDACREVTHHAQTWTVYSVTSGVVLEAVRGVREHQLNFWDAQIWAVARLNQIPVVLSEDFSEGAVLGGVRFVNPLRPAFHVTDWIK